MRIAIIHDQFNRNIVSSERSVSMKRLVVFLGLIVIIGSCIQWNSIGFYCRAFIDGNQSRVVENAPQSATYPLVSLADDSDVVRLFVIGDWGTGGTLQRHVATALMSLAYRESPHAIISTGDNFYPAGVQHSDDPLFQDRWERIYDDSSMRTIPWIIALGNHDHYGNIHALFAYSRRNMRWYCPAPYYGITLRSGRTSVALFVIDTHLFLTDRENRLRQLRWLDSALRATPATVRLAVGHHPIRSHGLYGETPLLIQQLRPILQQHRVHAYLCGHEHDIQIVRHYEDKFSCIVSGAGGQARRTRYGPFTSFAWTGGGFVYIGCRPDSSILVQVIDCNGRVRWRDTLPSVHRQGLEPRTR